MTVGVWVLGVTLAVAPSLHPLGNFSVNEYLGLTLANDRVEVVAVVDTAEIPTRQDRPSVDTDGDGAFSEAERAAFAARACSDVAAGLEVTVDSDRLQWSVVPVTYNFRPGASGLSTATLRCSLSAPAHLDRPATVTLNNVYKADRIGWHEVTARGDGVRLVDPPVPSGSLSDELRSYPDVSAPSSIIDVRVAVIRTEPGVAAEPGPVATVAPPGRLAAITAWSERTFTGLAGGRLTPLVGLLAVLVALLVGAGHAALPGHGKTVVAAYLAGRRGRPRDALIVGATVTLTHTAAVLVLGLVLTTAVAVAGDRVLGYLSVVSGLVIVAVGAGMAWSALRRWRHDQHHEHSHPHAHHPGRLWLAGMGVAGGLVPSPSALVVLLAAVGLGRAVFGVVLVLAYGLGMAATLTAAGLALLAVQRRLDRSDGRVARWAASISAGLPFVTAAVVLLVGVGLAARAAATLT
jgi:nickel/cobalt transporter (NicO) family protein